MLKAILIFLLVMWTVGWLFRWLLPFLLLRWMRRFQDQMKQVPRPPHNNRAAGNEPSAPKNRPSTLESKGEYVDYEEIK
ncbi:MAG: hypothetical protein RIS78_71 [Bacteroidota bacterium]|jgi:hypothetical protein